MKLYYVPGACSLACHIALEWIGEPYEAVRMTWGGVKSSEFLAMNPNGAVPLLTDGGYSLTQNAAILYYLADRHPESRLLGDGTIRGRADVMKWLAFLNSDVHPAFKPIFVPNRYLPDPNFAGAIADAARSHVRTYLAHIDKRLEGRDWLVDERSVADPYLFVLSRWAVRLNVGLDAFASLSRFSERMYADPSVRKVIDAEESAVGLAA